MNCKYCGTNLDNNATFCYNCGNLTDLGEQVQSRQNPAPVQQHYYAPQHTKEPISVGGWIGRTLIPCIPFVGGLVYLIMLFIWSGDTNKEDTFRNWAKAQLIVMAVVIVLTIIVFVIAAAAGVSVMNSLY